MATLTRAIALLGTAGVLVWAPAQSAAQTQADFDACNQQARANASNPSASPSTGPGGSMTSPGASTDTTRGGVGSPGSGATTTPGGASGSTGSYGSGTTSGGMSGSASPSGSGTSSGSMSGSSAGTTDQQLQGMAAAGMSNEMYQQAYRDCMRSRGF